LAEALRHNNVCTLILFTREKMIRTEYFRAVCSERWLARPREVLPSVESGEILQKIMVRSWARQEEEIALKVIVGH
jgi:hypothetical protein